MNYKLIAMDLDDTLLNDSLAISKENIEAIEFSHSKGVRTVICTGRSLQSVIGILEKYPIYTKGDFIISYNGATISNVAGEVIFEKVLDASIISKLVDISRSSKEDLQLYDYDNIYVEQYTERIAQYERLSGIKAKLVKDLKEVPMSIKALYNGRDVDKLEEIRLKIIGELSDKVNVFFSKETYLEVLVKEANKGLALAYLADYCNIDSKEVIAIGDSENDSFMIKYAGLGVCVQNGRQSVKSISDYVTTKTNNESAIAEVIQRYIR